MKLTSQIIALLSLMAPLSGYSQAGTPSLASSHQAMTVNGAYPINPATQQPYPGEASVNTVGTSANGLVTNYQMGPFTYDFSASTLIIPSSISGVSFALPVVQANSFVAGEAVTVNGSGVWVGATSNSTLLASNAVGVVTSTGLTSSTFTVVFAGVANVPGGGFTVGAIYYVPTTAGIVTATAPTTGGQYDYPIATAASPTALLVSPSTPSLVVAGGLPGLGANNTWTGTNTFNATVSIPVVGIGTASALIVGSPTNSGATTEFLLAGSNASGFGTYLQFNAGSPGTIVGKIGNSNALAAGGALNQLEIDSWGNLPIWTNGGSFLAGTFTSTGLSVNSGTASNPGSAFAGDATTGLYWANPGIGFSVAGSSVGTWTATGLIPAGLVEHKNGTAAAPGSVFAGATTTGLYWANPGVGVSVAGAGVGTFLATGLNSCAVGAGTASTGSFTTLTATGTTTLATTLTGVVDAASGVISASTALPANTTITTATTLANTTDAGYMGMPQNSQTGAGYTFALSDNGKQVFHAADSAGRTFTINSNANLALPIGFTCTLVNVSGYSDSLAITTDTLNWLEGGSTSTGTRTIANDSAVTITKVGATNWVVVGNGLS